MWIDLTTEDGELLRRVRVTVTDDPFYPVGRGPARAALMAEVEAAARAARAIETRPADRSPAPAEAPHEATRTPRLLRRLYGARAARRPSRSAATKSA